MSEHIQKKQENFFSAMDMIADVLELHDLEIEAEEDNDLRIGMRDGPSLSMKTPRIDAEHLRKIKQITEMGQNEEPMDDS